METNRERDMIAIARRAMNIPEGISGRLVPIGKGGSDRSYYRIRIGRRTAVLVNYTPERQENHYFVPIAAFLDEIGIRVPRILMHDPEAHVAVMEDLGDTDLWSYRFAPWGVRYPFYCSVLEMVSRLHRYPPEAFAGKDVPVMAGFDLSLYRWEQAYFRDHFLTGLCRLEPKVWQSSALGQELEALAARLVQHGRQLIHRDLQSQNIMISNNETVLIDFQGMRFGSPFYDLGSLLYDPYVELTDEERFHLLAHYYRISPPGLTWETYENRFYEASAQRLMQALGAYGFLGLKCGRTAFLEHVPSGLNHLLAVLSKTNQLPTLQQIAQQCLPVIEKT